MHDWYNAGIPMEEIIRRVYTMQFSDPVVLEVVKMTNKKLEKGSRYEVHDLDGDGVVTDEEIAREKEMVELELRRDARMARKKVKQSC